MHLPSQTSLISYHWQVLALPELGWTTATPIAYNVHLLLHPALVLSIILRGCLQKPQPNYRYGHILVRFIAKIDVRAVACGSEGLRRQVLTVEHL